MKKFKLSLQDSKSLEKSIKSLDNLVLRESAIDVLTEGNIGVGGFERSSWGKSSWSKSVEAAMDSVDSTETSAD